MIASILEFFFPERCRGCGMSGTALCTACKGRLRSADTIFEPANAFALYDYGQPIVRQAIWELKYHRKSAVAKVLMTDSSTAVTDYLASLLQSSTPMEIVLVPVPQHFSKTVARGFNQSQLIATWLQAALPQTVIRLLLKKVKATESQAHAQSRTQRQKNLHRSMQVVQKVAPLNKKVLYVIVDDVITTGSTIHEAGRALRAAGAKNICAIALAHGYARYT
jgi:ComF family protein